MDTNTTGRVRTALVIGGGIAGPVAATALVKAGIQASVHEAYPAPSEGIGGDRALAPTRLGALRTIGAGEPARAWATPISGRVVAVAGRAQRLPSLAGLEPLQI